MFASPNFELLSSPHLSGMEKGFLKTTELPLSGADADSATALLQRGKMIDEKANDETMMKLGNGNAIGILTRNVSLTGTKNLQWFQNLTLGGHIDTPVTRGLPVTLFMPYPGCEAIFEGAAVDVAGSAIDHLVLKTGTGAISGATAVDTALSVINGCWRIAQTGDFVLALLKQANYTPKTVGSIRIRVHFIPKYKI